MQAQPLEEIAGSHLDQFRVSHTLPLCHTSVRRLLPSQPNPPPTLFPDCWSWNNSWCTWRCCSATCCWGSGNSCCCWAASSSALRLALVDNWGGAGYRAVSGDCIADIILLVDRTRCCTICSCCLISCSWSSKRRFSSFKTCTSKSGAMWSYELVTS